MTDPNAKCSTLACPLDHCDQDNPNVVKVAIACNGTGCISADR